MPPSRHDPADPFSDPSVRIAGLGFLLIIGILVITPAATEQLLIGWLTLPLESSHRLSVDWPTVGVAALALTLFVGLLARGVRRWSRCPIRASAWMTLLFLVLFIAGTASVGFAHQMIWLWQGSGPRAERTNLTLPPGLLLHFGDEQAFRKSKWNMRELSNGTRCRAEADQRMPSGGTMTASGEERHGWLTYLNGYVGISPEGLDFDRPWNEGENASLFRCQVNLVVNPALPELFDSDGFGLSHVAANVRAMPITIVPPTAEARRMAPAPPRWTIDSFRDGTSTTILFGQVSENLQPWGSPRNVRDPALGIGHPQGFAAAPGEIGVQFGMADGAVRTLSNQTDRSIPAALATPDGGESPPKFDE